MTFEIQATINFIRAYVRTGETIVRKITEFRLSERVDAKHFRSFSNIGSFKTAVEIVNVR